MQWHPFRPIIATVSDLGLIHIWNTKVVEHWAAYAPGFEELEENIEYIEKEDEFDVVDQSVLDRRKMDEEDKLVDIIDLDPVASALDEPDPLIAVDSEDDADDFRPGQDADVDLGLAPFVDEGEDAAARNGTKAQELEGPALLAQLQAAMDAADQEAASKRSTRRRG